MKRRRLTSKNKGKTFRRIGLLMLGILLIAGIITAMIVLIDSASILSTLKELPFQSDSVYEYIDTGFLYIDNNKLNYYDISDEKKNYSVELSTPDVKIAGSSSITAVYNSYAMQIVGAEFPIEFSGQVQKIRCGAGYAAVLKSENGTEALQVFDSTGTQVDQITFDSRYLADFGFYGSSSEILWTLTMETSGSEPISTITTYDMAKAATTGVINIQSHLIEELIYSQNSLFVADTNNLVRFNHVRNNESWRLMIYGWHTADSFISDRPNFLLVPRNAANLSIVKLYTVEEGDMANETASIVHLPVNTIGAYLVSNKLISVTPNELLTYSIAGKPGESYPLEMTVEKAEKLDFAHILLQSGSKLYIVTIK